ncbi:MAG: diaminopropionate ammonia-lyase, partial [Intestinibacter sp.]|nr:diaminopropionate ammonia-lyase [Intestinibacter sp.]
MIKYEEHFGINILSTKLNSSNKIDFLTKSIVDDVEKFHTSIDKYKKTPLVKLDNLASKLGVKSIFVKDESYRYGLNAFKGLGGLYAIFRVVCNKLNLDHTSTTFEDLQKADIKEKLKDIVFVTATDG